MSYKTLVDRAVEFVSLPHLTERGETRPALRLGEIVAIPINAMPLLMSAAESLPSETRVNHPLIRSGYLYFEDPWPRPERGVHWNAVGFTYEVLHEDGQPNVWALHQGALALKEDGTWGVLDAPDPLPEDDLRYRMVNAFSLLVDQKVVVTATERPSRPVRRRAQREGRLSSDVTIVRLPYREYASESGEGGHGRYSHQWLVSGHWRQQPYPSVGEIRPLWIVPYVKGPAGKPLVMKERRYIFDPPTHG